MLPTSINAQEIIPQEGIARKFLEHLVNKEVSDMLPMFSEDFLKQVTKEQITEIAAGLPQAIMIVHGGRDYQVTIDDYNAWKAALKNHHNATFKLYPEMDHLFVAGDGPSKPASYFEENNVDKRVINDIAHWIRAQR